jgi:putative endonuclease
MAQGFVYIMANRRGGVIYVGVTNNLAARIFAHKEGRGSGFCNKYNIKKLVWYETYDMVTDVIQRETTMKHWSREWKIALIEKDNPNWDDLYETLG